MNDDAPIDDLLREVDIAFDDVLPPLPDALRAIAEEAYRWRRPDAALAELMFDSATEELAGVRGTSTDRRSFRYATGDSVLRLHLTEATMVVMIEPPLSVACRVASGADGSVLEHRTDELGELVVDAPDLPIRIEVDLPGGTVVTPWVTG